MRTVRVTHVVLVLLCVMYFITYVDRVNVSTAAAGFGHDFHLNNTQIGFVFSAFAYSYLVFQVIGGWISDRFGTRRTLIVCGLLWATATVLTGMAAGMASMIAARVLLGFGEGATFPAATAAMSRWVARAKRGYAQGITHAASRIGNAVAPSLVVVIMANYGWRVSFYACAALSFIWVALWAVTFTELPKDHPRITPRELAELPTPQPAPPRVPWMRLFKRMAPVTVVYFCYGWTLWLFLTWMPQYFLHSHHLDLKKSALFASAVFLAGVLGDTLGGVLTDTLLKRTGSLRHARTRMVSVCMLLVIVTLIPLMLTHSLTISLVSLSAGFFFAEMTIGPMWAIPMDVAPEHSGTASGMMSIGSAAAAIVSPVVGGYLIDRFGNWELPFVGSMILMAVGTVCAASMRPEARFEEVATGDTASAPARP